MAASIFYLYDSVSEEFINGTQDWDTDPHRAVLLLSTYTPATSHSTYADISAYECADGDYEAQDLTGEVVTLSGSVATAGVGAISFGSNVTITARYLAIVVGTVAGASGTDRLVGFALLDNTPADISVANSSLSMSFPSGVFATTSPVYVPPVVTYTDELVATGSLYLRFNMDEASGNLTDTELAMSGVATDNGLIYSLAHDALTEAGTGINTAAADSRFDFGVAGDFNFTTALGWSAVIWLSYDWVSETFHSILMNSSTAAQDGMWLLADNRSTNGYRFRFILHGDGVTNECRALISHTAVGVGFCMGIRVADDGTMSMLINGVDRTDFAGTTAAKASPNTDPLRLGQSTIATQYSWNGQFDDIAFFSSALSDAQFLALYNAGIQ